VKAAAPGVLCFVLATIIVTMVIANRIELKIDPGRLTGAPVAFSNSFQNMYVEAPPITPPPEPSADRIKEAQDRKAETDKVLGDRY